MGCEDSLAKGCIKYGLLAIIRYLVELPGSIGFHAIFKVACEDFLSGNPEMNKRIVRWLVQYEKQHLSSQGYAALSREEDCLGGACRNGHIDAVKWLIESKIAMTYSTDLGLSLYWSADYGHLDIVRWLVVEQGADLNVVDEEGHTPLARCVVPGEKSSLQMLLFLAEQKNADLTKLDINGRNLFQLA